jgi:hemolysin activation/secretion protein
VLAARARFSFGLDAFNATMNPGDLPDSRFVVWLGQVQWARQLTPWGLQVIARSDVQLASQPLLPLEQIAVGGRYTVRGYLENQVVRDNAVLASVETRIPLVLSFRQARLTSLHGSVKAELACQRPMLDPL